MRLGAHGAFAGRSLAVHWGLTRVSLRSHSPLTWLFWVPWNPFGTPAAAFLLHYSSWAVCSCGLVAFVTFLGTPKPLKWSCGLDESSILKGALVSETGSKIYPKCMSLSMPRLLLVSCGTPPGYFGMFLWLVKLM